VPVEAASPATFYFVDIGSGNATLVVTPAGETILLDCGTPEAGKRIVEFAKQNGIAKIDYLVVTHFEEDHMSGAPNIAAAMPILNWVDHGMTVTDRKSDDWWAAHRTLTPGRRPSPGVGQFHDKTWAAFLAAREKSGNHIVVKAGDKLPIKGMDFTVLSAAGKVISSPLKGAGKPNPACADIEKRVDDDAEDGQSVGMLLTMGQFRFAYLGDLTWNNSNSMFCPENRVGTVDAYLITHHAQSVKRSLGEYYWGLSCCSPAEVRGLHPRVAFLSLGSRGHAYGDSAAIDTVKASPGLEDLWQTEKITAGGEMNSNAPDQFIANIGGPPSERVPYIKMVANADGSFTVTNSRSQFTKQYKTKR
jgi:competence protein ComEC